MNNMLRDFNYLQRFGPKTHGQFTQTVQDLESYHSDGRRMFTIYNYLLRISKRSC